jgi:ankyrin repeat protein
MGCAQAVAPRQTLGHLAAFRGHIDVLRLLGRCGVSLEEQTSEGLLPAHYAVFSDNVRPAHSLSLHMV